jgi:hypothetical protein
MFFYVNDIVFAFTTSREKDAENLIRRLKDILDMRDLNSVRMMILKQSKKRRTLFRRRKFDVLIEFFLLKVLSTRNVLLL